LRVENENQIEVALIFINITSLSSEIVIAMYLKFDRNLFVKFLCGTRGHLAEISFQTWSRITRLLSAWFIDQSIILAFLPWMMHRVAYVEMFEKCIRVPWVLLRRAYFSYVFLVFNNVFLLCSNILWFLVWFSYNFLCNSF